MSEQDQNINDIKEGLQRDRKIVVLSFAAIRYKANLERRIDGFMDVLVSMIEHINSKKNERKATGTQRNNPNIKLPMKSTKKAKLTFQMVGSYLKKDPFYCELNLQ